MKYIKILSLFAVSLIFIFSFTTAPVFAQAEHNGVSTGKPVITEISNVDGYKQYAMRIPVSRSGNGVYPRMLIVVSESGKGGGTYMNIGKTEQEVCAGQLGCYNINILAAGDIELSPISDTEDYTGYLLDGTTRKVVDLAFGVTVPFSTTSSNQQNNTPVANTNNSGNDSTNTGGVGSTNSPTGGTENNQTPTLGAAPCGTVGAAPCATTSGSAASFDLKIKLNNPLKVNTIQEVVQLFVNGIVRLAIPVLVVFYIWAGLSFIFARGNPDKLKKAKTMFFYTIIGTLLILGAWAITNAIIGTVNSIIE